MEVVSPLRESVRNASQGFSALSALRVSLCLSSVADSDRAADAAGLAFVVAADNLDSSASKRPKSILRSLALSSCCSSSVATRVCSFEIAQQQQQHGRRAVKYDIKPVAPPAGVEGSAKDDDDTKEVGAIFPNLFGVSRARGPGQNRFQVA